MSEMHESTPVSQPIPHFESFLDSREPQHCCKSIRKHSYVSHVKARYAPCGSENYGASAHPISTRGSIRG